MADVKQAVAVWQSDLTFEGRANSNIPVMMDGRAKAGVSPMEMLLLGLAGCTAADVVDILKKKRQQVTGLEVQVVGHRAEAHPKKYTAFEVNYVVTGHAVDPLAVARAIELSETTYCSVSATVRGVASITSHYEIREAEMAPVQLF